MNIFQTSQFFLLHNGWKLSPPHGFTYKSNSTRKEKKKKFLKIPQTARNGNTKWMGIFFKSWILRACLVLLTRKFESWSINPELINGWWQFASLNSQVWAYSLLGSSNLCGEMLANRISRARGGQSLWWKMCPLLINGQQLVAAVRWKSNRSSVIFVFIISQSREWPLHWLSQDFQNLSTKVHLRAGAISSFSRGFRN